MKKNYFNLLFHVFFTLCLISVAIGQSCTPPGATVTPAGFAIICDTKEGVSLKATEGAGLTYQWKKNGMDIPGATSQTYMAKETGSYSVATSSGVNCSATSTPTYVQQSQPNKFVINVNPKKATTCGEDSATLRVNPGMGSYQWYSNGVAIDKATSFAYKTAIPGSYYVKIVMQGSCPMSSDTATISAGEAPAKPTVTMEADSLVSSIAPNYQWLYDDSPIPSATKRKIRPLVPGTYKVRVGTQGCSTTSDAYDFLITSVQDINSTSEITVYPSPFSNSLFINSSIATDLKVGFYNNLGSLIYETATTSNAEIVVKDLPTGIYNVKVQSGAKTYFTKIVKQ